MSEISPSYDKFTLIPPSLFSEVLQFEDSFHTINWDKATAWIQKNIRDEEQLGAYEELALHWTLRLRDDLGGEYKIAQSRYATVLAGESADAQQWLLKYADKAVFSVRDHLGAIAWEGSTERVLIFAFSEQDDFYQYIARYYPPGEDILAAGVAINRGYTHIALIWTDEIEVANTMIHELVHDALVHLSIPTWLNEGLALSFQRIIAPRRRALGEGAQESIYGDMINWQPPLVWDELAERHFNFWNQKNIQEFWAGTSFHQPGDPSELSYNLAEILIKLLSDKARPESFRGFVQGARYQDAGLSGAFDLLDVDLGMIVATFLGEGDWRPDRKSIAALLDAQTTNKDSEPNP